MASTSSPRLRKRVVGPKSPALSEDLDSNNDHVSTIYGERRERNSLEKLFETDKVSYIVMAVLTIFSFVLRFFKLNHPDQVVFDEVHFGKFAAYYIKREYYFDVHPPLAKLLFGLVGWFVGFDGNFDFENIGDSYTKHHVPYIGMRAFPAFLSSVTVPIVYAIMKQCGYSTVIAAFSASIVMLDNAHVAQSRLILLDATLIFFISLTMYSYIRFRKLRYWEFSLEWWGWLVATGFFMACAWGSKVNGPLTVVAIGIAVLIDLWGLLDVNKEGHTMEYFWKHFGARAIGLIVLPFIFYLSFFYVHFAVLNKSGTGDIFMSPAFQETLVGNELLLSSQELHYYDVVTIKHKDTKAFLHSHPERYPLQYDDGRISSQGQQVTAYSHEDFNNHWQILPTKALPEAGRGRIVRNEDVIQLLHVGTQSYLLTHDVASPLMPTNQEFTTHPVGDHSRYNETLFQLFLHDAPRGQAVKSKSGHFQLAHLATKVRLWTHPEQLPEWAFKQQEVNGNKNPSDKSATWFVDDIILDDEDEDYYERTTEPPKEPKKMSFIKKFAELQLLMLQHNAGLTASHPYASAPINWPFLLSGISFWTENEKSEQIYLVGNLIGWWTCVMALSIYVGILGADLLARRRNIYPLEEPTRNRLWNSAGFFMIFWAVHYVPFFLMNRQLFIHHYLPSHLSSALVAGAALSFICSDTVNYPISVAGRNTRRQPRTYADLGTKGVVIVGAFMMAMLAMYVYMAPLTYGSPGLDGDGVNSKRLLSSWTLHFAGKETGDVNLD